MLTKQDMEDLDGAIRSVLVAKKEELKISDQRLGKQAFGYMSAPRMKVQALFVAQGKGELRKPQTINVAELLNLCEAMGLSWKEVVTSAIKKIDK